MPLPGARGDVACRVRLILQVAPHQAKHDDPRGSVAEEVADDVNGWLPPPAFR